MTLIFFVFVFVFVFVFGGGGGALKTDHCVGWVYSEEWVIIGMVVW